MAGRGAVPQRGRDRAGERGEQGDGVGGGEEEGGGSTGLRQQRVVGVKCRADRAAVSSSLCGLSERMPTTTILHLSDLHFRGGESSRAGSAREVALRELIGLAASWDGEWRPDLVVVTGDIAWAGTEGDYRAAEEWLRRLLGALNLDPAQLHLCPGNHDVYDPDAEQLAWPAEHDTTQADNLLAGPVPPLRQGLFREFEASCRRLGVPPSESVIGCGDPTALWGVRRGADVDIFVCNSAWFARAKVEDRNRLWLGLPLLKHVEAAGHLHRQPTARLRPLVTLCHHPGNWLAEAETVTHGGRPATWDYLAERSDLILTGHTHGTIRKADRVSEAAWHLTAGATYAGDRHPNNVRLIRVDRDGFEYRSFEFDPAASSAPWLERNDMRGRLQFSQAPPVPSATATPPAGLSSAIARHARGLIEQHQRAIARSPTLPRLLDRTVELRPPGWRDRAARTAPGDRSSPQPPRVPLVDALQQRSFLLGDMGAGKSTLCATLLLHLREIAPERLVVLIPAGHWRDLPITTAADLLNAASRFLVEHVAIDVGRIDLKSLASSGHPVDLIIDGLDELQADRRVSLLTAASAVTGSSLDVRVLVAGRSAELAQLDLGAWLILVVPELDQEEQVELLAREGEANGRSRADSMEKALSVDRRIREGQGLAAAMNTPLAVRAFYQVLAEDTVGAAPPTTGDLLGRFCELRVAEWDLRTGHGSRPDAFIAEHPDPLSRLRVLANIAVKIREKGEISRDAALDVLEREVLAPATANRRTIAVAALDFFLEIGLLGSDGGLRFPLAAVHEYLLGVGLAESWRQGATATVDPVVEWRAAIYATSILRRRGAINECRTLLEGTADSLVEDGRNLPGAALMICEAADPALAQRYLDQIGVLEWHPLQLFWDERAESGRAVARVIHLAADGFAWWTNRYLDARYPARFVGSGVFDEVIAQWCALVPGFLTPAQRGQLAAFASAVAGGSGLRRDRHALACLAAVIPEQFEPATRHRLLTTLLWRGPLRDRATTLLRGAHQRDDEERAAVNAALIARAAEGYEAAFPAARLWMDWNQSPPTPSIIEAVLGGLERGLTELGAWWAAVDECARRLGEVAWARRLRWVLHEGTRAAKGAALVLHRDGEMRLHVLGPVLLDALHGGGTVPGAEAVLAGVLEGAGRAGWSWMAGWMAMQVGPMDAAHPGTWRLLLKHLDTIGPEGPDILQTCVGAAARWTLPRHPDIRAAFRRLLDGPFGPAYESMLLRRLESFDASVRQAAGMILIACDPTRHPVAFEEVLRGADGDSWGNTEEWQALLLSMEPGPTVLDHLMQVVADLPPQAAAMARLLLWRAGRLPEVEIRRLVRGVLAQEVFLFGGRDLDARLLGTTLAQEVMLAALTAGEGKSAQNAADGLLRYHLSELSAADRARAIAFSVGRDSIRLGGLIKVLEGDVSDEDFRAVLQTQERGGGLSVVAQLARAHAGVGPWEELLHLLFVDDSNGLGGPGEGEAWGWWLIEYGHSNADRGREMGTAAAKLLASPASRASRRNTSRRLWLALLAHEFGAADEATLREQLTGSAGVRDAEIAVALFARIAPAECQGVPIRVDAEPSQPVWRLAPTLAPDILADRISAFARPSEDFPPDGYGSFRQLVLMGGDRLRDDLVPAVGGGRNWALLRSALVWLLGGEASEDVVASAWPMEISEHAIQQNPGLGHLHRIWSSIHLDGCFADPKKRQTLIEAFRRRIGDPAYDADALGVALLAVRGRLEAEEVQPVLDRLVWGGARDDHGVVRRLVDWLTSDRFTDADRAGFRHAVHRALGSLDAKRDRSEETGRDAPRVPLFLGAVTWYLGGAVDGASVRVFLRGLGGFVARIDRQDGIDVVLDDLGPLLDRMPADAVARALDIGFRTGVPRVRSLCALLLRAGRTGSAIPVEGPGVA